MENSNIITALLAIIALLNTIYLIQQNSINKKVNDLTKEFNAFIKDFIKLQTEHNDKKDKCGHS